MKKIPVFVMILALMGAALSCKDGIIDDTDGNSQVTDGKGDGDNDNDGRNDKDDDSSGESGDTFVFGSTGDLSSDDDIANTKFTRKISITYSASGTATVKGDSKGYVKVSGNKVTVNNTGSECIVYELSGTADDGFFKLYGTKKQAILLNGVKLTNKSGAAINNQNKKRTFVMIEGENTLADGKSYSGTAGEDEKAAFFSEGQLIFSGKGTLEVNASGKSGITSDDYIRIMDSPAINVTSSAGHALRGKDAVIVDSGNIKAKATANMKKGFSSDSLVVFNGGTTHIEVTGSTASENGEYTSPAGVKADKLFYMNGGSLEIVCSGSGSKGISVGTNDTANDCKAYFKGGEIDIKSSGSYYTSGGGSASKGIKVGKKIANGNRSYIYTGDMYISGGLITVSCTGSSSSRDGGNEAIESKGVIDITGGEVFAYSSSDDAINSADDFTVSDGYVCGISTANDGLDANGNFYVKGGVVYAAGASSPELGIDANSEENKKLYVTGGIMFVTGGLERGASLTQKCYSASSFSKNAWYGLTVGSEVYAFKTSSASGTPLVVSGPSTPVLKSGVTVSGGTGIFNGYGNRGCILSGGSNVSLSSYTASSGGGGWPGGQP